MSDPNPFELTPFEQTLIDTAHERRGDAECFVCGRSGCIPLKHKARLLSHQEAIHFASNLLKHPGGESIRALMLARYIVEKL